MSYFIVALSGLLLLSFLHKLVFSTQVSQNHSIFSKLLTLQELLCSLSQMYRHCLGEVGSTGSPDERVRDTLYELEGQDPDGLRQNRHVDEAQAVAEQAGVEDLNVAVPVIIKVTLLINPYSKNKLANYF